MPHPGLGDHVDKDEHRNVGHPLNIADLGGVHVPRQQDLLDGLEAFVLVQTKRKEERLGWMM